MSKFAALKNTLIIASASVGSRATHNGGTGYAADDKTTLYALAVTNLVAETSFYESATARDARFVDLVQTVTATDPKWVAQLVAWLRHEAHMRSAAAVLAAEYVKAGGPNGRAVVVSACARADEPAEVLAYWLTRYGKPLPAALKRGVADAARALYTGATALKWDSSRNRVRMGDVIELTHPKPVDETQSALFHYLLDVRHGRDDVHVHESLSALREAFAFDAVPVEERRSHAAAHGLPSLYTWERLSGWLPGGMDASAWEAAIPSMGYTALLRNLRNFEAANVAPAVLDQVATRLADPTAIAASRQLPYRFWSAYRATKSKRFAPVLEAALQASVARVPKLTGRTLVAVDTSGSMQSPVANRSEVLCVEVAAVFAAAVAQGSEIDLMIYADKGRSVSPQPTVLQTVKDIEDRVGEVGHGTNTWPSVLEQYDGQDRIIVFTDMQDDPAAVPTLPDVPVYVWDLRGYGVSNIDPGHNRYLLSGFSDASFGVIERLEGSKTAGWPWEA